MLVVPLLGTRITYQFSQELEFRQKQLPDHVPAAQHEEQHAGQGGHDDQQRQPDALPHAAGPFPTATSGAQFLTAAPQLARPSRRARPSPEMQLYTDQIPKVIGHGQHLP